MNGSWSKGVEKGGGDKEVSRDEGDDLGAELIHDLRVFVAILVRVVSDDAIQRFFSGEKGRTRGKTGGALYLSNF